ncbi:PAS-domain containing protein [Shimia sp.]|uniref:PAS-domain containing protein n=1 Tax=Shimia sp. TaxID=1954381 RepID=UPI003564BBF4
MVETGTIQDLLPLLAGVALGLGAGWLMHRLRARASWRRDPQHPGPDHDSGGGAVLLYRDGLLTDATPEGHALLGAAPDHGADWAGLAAILTAGFPGFPSIQPATDRPRHRIYRARNSADSDFVALHLWDNMARVTLHRPDPARPGYEGGAPGAVSVQSARAIADAPYPVWQSNALGQLVWANASYFRLAESLGVDRGDADFPVLFDPEATQKVIATTPDGAAAPHRVFVADPAATRRAWFDVSTVAKAGMRTHYATPADAIVQAEIAQRNFVQTLTKTFAQLSIGLAIFDRNRQLALFNPALIDLTSLPADFLSARPNLASFFDRMRENRMMPEPRDYATWRKQIARLVVAASDDRFAETWSLPSGVTYRVLGRPHPDGAIAFLFEDISAEVSLTRRFRTELDLGQGALDSVRDALAVFSPTGQLSLCNSAYRHLWQCEPEQSLAEHGLQDAMDLWRAACKRSDAWEKLRHHVLDLHPRDDWAAALTLETGEALGLRVASLHAGYTSVVFEPRREDGQAAGAAELRAG